MMRISEKIPKFNLEPRGVRIFEQILNGLRTNFGCLKVIFSSSVENLFRVFLLFKILRNLVECKPFKTSCEFIFFQIKINFPKKSSNFN